MLTTIMTKLARSATSNDDDATNLLTSCSLPDPDVLRRELAKVESQLAADDAAWERLDRTSNPHAFTTQQQIAARRGSLEAQRDALRWQLAAVEKARAAFVELINMLRAMDQDITQASQRLYADVLILSEDDRRVRLASLDGLVRSRARIAAPLAVVAPARKFRRAPDPFAALAQDLRARADEIERLLGPGMPRAPIAWPNGAQELVAALNQGRSA